jgi:hypothetical protein
VIFSICCLIGTIPQLIALVSAPDQFFSRANGTTEEYSWAFDSFNTFFRALTSYISPEFLFFSFKGYNNLSMGRLLMVEFFPFYIGLFFIYKLIDKKQVITTGHFYFLLFIAVIPGVLTKENPHALRTASLAVLAPLITAAGIVVIYRYITSNFFKNFFLFLATGLIIWNGIYFVKIYSRSDELKSQNMQPLLTKATQRLAKYKDKFDFIYIDKNSNQPYIYVLMFCKVKPEDFQHAIIERNDSKNWDSFRRVGKYYFLSSEEIAAKVKASPEPSLILLPSKTNDYPVIDSVQHLDGKMYFYAYRSAGK